MKWQNFESFIVQPKSVTKLLWPVSLLKSVLYRSLDAVACIAENTRNLPLYTIIIKLGHFSGSIRLTLSSICLWLSILDLTLRAGLSLFFTNLYPRIKEHNRIIKSTISYTLLYLSKTIVCFIVLHIFSYFTLFRGVMRGRIGIGNIIIQVLKLKNQSVSADFTKFFHPLKCYVLLQMLEVLTTRPFFIRNILTRLVILISTNLQK